jgi:hypothetical protein
LLLRLHVIVSKDFMPLTFDFRGFQEEKGFLGDSKLSNRRLKALESAVFRGDLRRSHFKG